MDHLPAPLDIGKVTDPVAWVLLEQMQAMVEMFRQMMPRNEVTGVERIEAASAGDGEPCRPTATTIGKHRAVGPAGPVEAWGV